MLNGKDKNAKEQMLIFKKIIRKSPIHMQILKTLDDYAKENPSFRNHYLGGGCINQAILNYMHKFPLDYGIKDYDIVYYDEDTSYESEDKIIKDLQERLKFLKVEIDIKNQKRVPIWYKEKYKKEKKPYTSLENAVSRWGTTITCIGIRLENNRMKVCCPYGLNDLFSLKIHPIKSDYTEEEYNLKTIQWKEKWPNIQIEEW